MLPFLRTPSSCSCVCLPVCQWELAWRASPKFRDDAPTDGCNWAPQSFCPGFCTSALSPQHQEDPEEAEPRSSAVSPEFQSRQALGTDHSVPQPTCPELLLPAPATCVWDTSFVWRLWPVPSSGMWDKGCLFFPGTVALPGLCLGHHRIPLAPKELICPHCCPFQVGGSAGSWHTADEVCEQCVGSVRTHGEAITQAWWAGGVQGHPPQLRAASRGLGKACVSL